MEGNAVRLLRDAGENYPAWLDAIARAERFVCFESYIIRDDVSGRLFAEALRAKSHEGVAVYVLYDWVGALGKTSARFWASLRAAGIEVRSFNPPRLSSPLGWIQRDHRKCIVVDGRIGFITGLCVGDDWVGDPERGIAPWRDTGIEVRGPAVAEIEAAFARIWARTGAPMAAVDGRPVAEPRPAGDVAMRIVASEPSRAELLRVDQLVAAAARESLWLADAYYAGAPSHAQALRSAARDGVDVRLLVPGTTDIPIVRPLSRAGYRPLLEAGVRIFEWNGTMLHSKTAVADRRWARVGSSNLNLASWLTNYELDALIEDADFADTMARQYLEDLANSTEVLLRERRSRGPASATPGASDSIPRPRVARGGSRRRAAVGALRLGHTVTSAVTSHRALASQDAGLVAASGFAIVLLAIAAVYWPRLVAVPLAVVGAWVGVTLLARAIRLRYGRPPETGAAPNVGERPPSGDREP